MADPVGFDEVRSNPPFLVRWRPFTTSLAVLFSPFWLNIGRISIRYSLRIAQYLLVSVDQVRFCGELLFFSSSFFFFFFLIFFFFFPSLSLSPGMGSVPGRAHFLPITLFFSSLVFPLFYTSFFPSFTLFFPLLFCPTLISSSHFPPAFHFILFPFFFGQS